MQNDRLAKLRWCQICQHRRKLWWSSYIETAAEMLPKDGSSKVAWPLRPCNVCLYFTWRRATMKIEGLFHTCLDCFMVSHIGAPGLFVSNTTVKSLSGFSWNFQDMLALTQGVNLNIFGDDRFKPLDTEFLILFSGSVLVGNVMDYRMNGHSWNLQGMDTRNNRLHCFALE